MRSRAALTATLLDNAGPGVPLARATRLISPSSGTFLFQRDYAFSQGNAGSRELSGFVDRWVLMQLCPRTSGAPGFGSSRLLSGRHCGFRVSLRLVTLANLLHTFPVIFSSSSSARFGCAGDFIGAPGPRTALGRRLMLRRRPWIYPSKLARGFHFVSCLPIARLRLTTPGVMPEPDDAGPYPVERSRHLFPGEIAQHEIFTPAFSHAGPWGLRFPRFFFSRFLARLDSPFLLIGSGERQPQAAAGNHDLSRTGFSFSVG